MFLSYLFIFLNVNIVLINFILVLFILVKQVRLNETEKCCLADIQYIYIRGGHRLIFLI